MIFQKFSKLLEKMSRLLFGSYFERQYNSEVLTKVLGDEPEEALAVPARVLSSSEMSKKKKEIFEKCLELGVTSVQLDATLASVVVPDRFKGARDLVLNYSYRYGVHDFSFDEKFIVASLTFSGVPFRCIVSWDAVLGIGSQVSKEFYSFHPEASPQEAAQLIPRAPSSPEARRKTFQVIKGGRA